MSNRRKRREQRVARWARRQTPQPAAETPESATRPARRGGRLRTVALLATLLLALLAGAASAVLVLVTRDGPSGPPAAAIIDQLSLSHPNPGFVESATAKLEAAGYQVDYVPGEQVTVDFFRDLPKRGYDYIFLRVHTAQFDGLWRDVPHDEGVLFTVDPYVEEEHIAEQWELQLNPVFAYEGAPRFFGIAPNFVESAMAGNFRGATVVLMGCGGLKTERLAEAFRNKGADVVVGWNDLVSAEHTDAAAGRLLDHLLTDKMPAQEAAAKTNAELGADPTYHSFLLSYPR